MTCTYIRHISVDHRKFVKFQLLLRLGVCVSTYVMRVCD